MGGWQEVVDALGSSRYQERSAAASLRREEGNVHGVDLHLAHPVDWDLQEEVRSTGDPRWISKRQFLLGLAFGESHNGAPH